MEKCFFCRNTKTLVFLLEGAFSNDRRELKTSGFALGLAQVPGLVSASQRGCSFLGGSRCMLVSDLCTSSSLCLDGFPRPSCLFFMALRHLFLQEDFSVCLRQTDVCSLVCPYQELAPLPWVGTFFVPLHPFALPWLESPCPAPVPAPVIGHGTWKVLHEHSWWNVSPAH